MDDLQVLNISQWISIDLNAFAEIDLSPPRQVTDCLGMLNAVNGV